MNVDSYYYPRPHPGWGPIAEELLFYSSRYLHYAISRLEGIAGEGYRGGSRFRAQFMGPRLRLGVAELLAGEPGKQRAQAILRLLNSASVDRRLPKPRPFLKSVLRRPDQYAITDRVHPLTRFQYVANRYRIPIDIDGNCVTVNSRCCERVFGERPTCMGVNLLVALRLLARSGYQVRMSESGTSFIPSAIVPTVLRLAG